MTLKDIFFAIVTAEYALRGQLELKNGFFSTSLKRSAGALMRSFYDLGINSESVLDSDTDVTISSYRLNVVTERAKEFETVLANELPGLATYVVSPKGIYATDDLISHAEMHVPEKCRSILSPKAAEDIQQAGKCLAFEVATASAFHVWRAVESVMDSYYEALTTKTFSAAGLTRNWGEYIKALVKANAEKKITSFLDHIREEYRNPISHPDETLDLDEAFGLFGAALSVIGQMLRAILDNAEEVAAKDAAAAVLAGNTEKAKTTQLGALLPLKINKAGAA
jgi:hypothetical protein